MDNAWKMINGIVSNLTDVLVGVLGLGIVGALVFGDVLGLDVIGNITALVEMLTSNGVVGTSCLSNLNESC
jgi:hypothetical protein